MLFLISFIVFSCKNQWMKSLLTRLLKSKSYMPCSQYTALETAAQAQNNSPTRDLINSALLSCKELSNSCTLIYSSVTDVIAPALVLIIERVTVTFYRFRIVVISGNVILIFFRSHRDNNFFWERSYFSRDLLPRSTISNFIGDCKAFNVKIDAANDTINKEI